MLKSKEDEIGRTCNTHGDEICFLKFRLENLKGIAHLEVLGIVGEIILK
jgi:hypothetical protein